MGWDWSPHIKAENIMIMSKVTAHANIAQVRYEEGRGRRISELMTSRDVNRPEWETW